MLKKTITYTDFNGQERKEDFYFNLSKAEIVELELSENLSGGLKSVLETIIASNNGRQIMTAFKDVIARAYGIKSPDGRSFMKSPEISAGFLGSEAYSIFFMELLNDPANAADFINAVVPQDLVAQQQTTENVATRSVVRPQDHLQKAPITRNLPTPPVETPENIIARPQAEQGMSFQDYETWLKNQQATDQPG